MYCYALHGRIIRRKNQSREKINQFVSNYGEKIIECKRMIHHLQSIVSFLVSKQVSIRKYRVKNMNGPKRSRVRYLRHLAYLLPIIAVIGAYGLLTVVTQENPPFTIVTGTSMQPTILPGSIAMIGKIPFDQLQVGDVIVHSTQDSLLSPCDSSSGSPTSEVSNPCFVIHRIIDIENDSSGNRMVTTKGDDNSFSIPGIDTGINQSMYLGEVILQLPVLGYLTVQPYNEIAAFVIFAALVVELLFERRQSNST